MEIKEKSKGIEHYIAHEIASKKYNYSKEADEYYDSLKRNKN